MMSIQRLDIKRVEKPWGRRDIDGFANPDGDQIGEIWFDQPDGPHLPLLVKYIFTSDKLSIQVHPETIHEQGFDTSGGKSECWYVLSADPGARLGIGTRVPLDDVQLRTAAIDGRLEQLVEWWPVQAGSFFYIPAGTIHAIGGGITLIEVQQNKDVTYRLFDYGRPRELHLDEAVAAAKAQPYSLGSHVAPMGQAAILLEQQDAPFRLHMLHWNAGLYQLTASPGWFIPLSGAGMMDGAPWASCQCWLIDGSADIEVLQDATILWATLPQQPK